MEDINKNTTADVAEAELETSPSSGKRSFGQKFGGFVKKHWIFFTVLAVMFVSTFFIRARSVQIRYEGAHTYEYVRIDYSIYGYCVGVRPMRPESKQAAKDLSKRLLFSSMESSVEEVVDLWTYYYGDDQNFNVKVKGYLYNTNERRDELIDFIRELAKEKNMNFKADAII